MDRLRHLLLFLGHLDRVVEVLFFDDDGQLFGGLDLLDGGVDDYLVCHNIIRNLLLPHLKLHRRLLHSFPSLFLQFWVGLLLLWKYGTHVLSLLFYNHFGFGVYEFGCSYWR